jgi:hypothetical protein
MLFLKLDCGRDVALDEFCFSRTYSGLMVGAPDQETNDEIIERAKRRMDPVWGTCKTHVIPPVINISDPAHPHLPPVLWRAWFFCTEPIDKRFMASELVVVWFTEECYDRPIAEVVFEAIHALPWDELAQDFDW